MEIVEFGEGIYTCGITANEDTHEVLTQLQSLGIQYVMTVALLQDQALVYAGSTVGMQFRHEPVRRASPGVVRKLASVVQRQASHGVGVLIVGETSGGVAKRIAGKAAIVSGKALA